MNEIIRDDSTPEEAPAANVVFEVEEKLDEQVDTPPAAQPQAFPKKSRAQAKKHWETWYNRNYFEYLRGGTIRRILTGFPVRYTTLVKYDLVDFYKKNTPKKNLAKFEYQKVYDRRLKKIKRPYANQVADRVANAMRVNEIGTTIPVDGIKIYVNPNTDNADAVPFNTNPLTSGEVRVVKPPRENAPPAPPVVNGRYTIARVRWIFTYQGYKLNKRRNDPDPFLDPKAAEKYIKHIETAAQRLKCIQAQKVSSLNEVDLVACFKNYTKRMIKKLATQDGTKSANNLISVIARSLPGNDEIFAELMGDKLKLWNEVNEELWQERRQKNKKQLDEPVVAYKFLVNMLKDLRQRFLEKPDDIDRNYDYLLMALYILRNPIRDNYAAVKIVDTIPLKADGTLQKKDETGIYPDYYSPKSKTFALQSYKSRNKFGQVRQTVREMESLFKFIKRRKLFPVSIGQAIKESLDALPRSYLFAKVEGRKDKKVVDAPYNKGRKLTRRILDITARYDMKEKNFGKNVGVNELRHAFVSHCYCKEKFNENQKEKLALLMLHSVKTAKEVYLRACELSRRAIARYRQKGYDVSQYSV